MNEKKAQILMVEDDPVVSFHMKKILSQDYTVHHASSYDKAFDFLEQGSFDLILLDINLGPDSLSGVELLGHIRDDERFDDVKIFAVTSEPLHEVKENFLVGGFDRYISKPVEKEDLIRAIEEVLSAR
ncbi:MAG: response regulator [Bacteroidota bacterium]